MIKKFSLVLLVTLTILILTGCDPYIDITFTGTGTVYIYTGDQTTTCGEVTAMGDDGNDYTGVIYEDLSNLDRNVPGEYSVYYYVFREDVLDAEDDYRGVCEYMVVDALNGISNQTIMYGESFDPLNGVSATDLSGNDITEDIVVESDVNVNEIGTYTVTYTIDTPEDGIKTASAQIVVDSDFDPEFLGVSNKTIKIGDTIELLDGITATDFEDGDLTESIIVDGTVDTTTAGDYTISISITDADENTITDSYTVTVETDTDPVISGTQDVTLYEGSSLEEFTEALYTDVSASDVEDGNLTNELLVELPDEITELGDYTVTYSITDSDENTVSTSIILTIIADNEPALNGTQDIVIYQGQSYDLLNGITALDDKNGDITNSISFTEAIDVHVPEIYSVTYSVTDSFGHTVESTITLTVLEDTAPSILGTADFSVDQGSTYDLLQGVTATDELDGDLTTSIQVVDTIDINTPGEYSVAYSVMDSYGNITVENITVTVLSTASEYTGAVLYAVAFDATTVDITFDIDFLDNTVVDLSAFTITIDSVDATITDSFIFVDTISLQITETMTEFSTIEVSYTPTGLNDLTYGGILIPGFTNEPVIPPTDGGF